MEQIIIKIEAGKCYGDIEDSNSHCPFFKQDEYYFMPDHKCSIIEKFNFPKDECPLREQEFLITKTE